MEIKRLVEVIQLWRKLVLLFSVHLASRWPLCQYIRDNLLVQAHALLVGQIFILLFLHYLSDVLNMILL